MTHPDKSARPCGLEHSPKRRQILAGAREVFGEMGFERASVDQVAARAGVSKATVYNHFLDKKTLFVACFSEEADELRDALRCKLLRSEPDGEIGPALQAVGEHLMSLFLAPAIVALYRNTSAEVERFPELGALLFEHGPAAMHAAVAEYLRRWQDIGALHLPDVHAAAVQFVLLCKGDLAVRSQFGVLPDPLEPAIVATVQRAVAVFLAAYGAALASPARTS
ncbi:TetR/AcrR family transcriptional regulator [Nannocystis radixulma]|uniref:TetR/AcrR family transcriptional regulator n=1 Tax=Nannocystis radixulma TaxID=2995305 RepID=A0ABT5BA18_9BACT|nr:TetR/AcrR family transcriptional regulator [Nannocystis radixulma]MDC0669846.1 TetR/AcrR family transcriptional regulator [Nannocystis radixulma]